MVPSRSPEGGSEIWAASGCILRVEPRGFEDRWDVGIRGQEEAMMTTRLVASAQGRVVVTLQEPGHWRTDGFGKEGWGRPVSQSKLLWVCTDPKDPKIIPWNKAKLGPLPPGPLLTSHNLQAAERTAQWGCKFLLE